MKTHHLLTLILYLDDDEKVKTPLLLTLILYLDDDEKVKTHHLLTLILYLDDDEKVKTHHLLTLLLRMRQICCHPGLIKGMLDQETKEAEGIIEEDGEDLDLLSKLEDMTINKESKGSIYIGLS